MALGIALSSFGIGLVLLLLLPLLGGAGLLFGLFSGLKSIPSFLWIGAIILTIFVLLKGGRR